MNKKLLIETIPLALLVLFGLGVFVKVPYGAMIAVISGGLLAMLYFYGAFWLFSDIGMPMPGRIVAGFLFSVNIIGCLFCLLHWPFWRLYGIVSYIGLGVVIIICLFNYRSSWFNPIFYRCILFLVLLSAIFGYRYFSA